MEEKILGHREKVLTFPANLIISKVKFFPRRLGEKG